MDSDKQVKNNVAADEISFESLLLEGETRLTRQDFVGAANVFDKAAAMNAASPTALHGAALARHSAGNSAGALPFFEKAVTLAPQNPVYANNLAMALVGVNRLFEAKSALILATRLSPDYADAWSNLAMVLMRLKENSEVVERAILSAINANSVHIQAHMLMAELRFSQNRYREAAAAYLRLADIAPNRKAAFTARAAICHAKLKDFTASATLFGKAAKFAPENGEIMGLYGTVLGECGRLEEAKTVLRHATTLKGGKDIFRWKHLWYCPEYFPDSAAIDEFWANLQKDLAEAVAEAPTFDWRLLVDQGFAGSFNLTHLRKNYRPVLEQYVNFFQKSFPFPKPEKRDRSARSGRIRIGFFAAPMQVHGFFRIISGIIKNLDPTMFERVLFYPRNMVPLFKELQGPNIIHAPYFGTFETIVKGMREAELDILYHWKAGETPFTLFTPMCNVAPVQCTSWGTHGTSGIRHIDYFLSWDEAEPANGQELYSETLVRLKTPPILESEPQTSPTASREQLGLPPKGTLFFCPHRMPKYHPDFDFYLRDILEGDETAHILLLFESALPGEELTRRRMIQNVGIKNFRRLLFLPRTNNKRFLQFYAIADMVLDSPAYSTSLSGFDAIYFGKPIITQEGNSLVERYAIANYHAMRIFDAPITTNREDYVKAALRLSFNAEERKELSERIRANARIFMDTAAITNSMNEFFATAGQ